MKVLRLAWSSYQSDDSLKREEKTINRAGFEYVRAIENGVYSEENGVFDVIIVNSQYTVNEEKLEQWSAPDAVITASSGYDHIDLEACREVGVTVIRTPLARAKRVVDHTLAMTQALLRNLPGANQQLRRGEWKRKGSFYKTQRLSSLTVGVLGFGVIGERVAQAMVEQNAYRVIACDPARQGSIEESPGVELVSPDQLVQESHLLTLHVDGREENEDLINGATFQTMPEPAYLINTSRGCVVQFDDLLQALRTGELDGAGIDVYPEEPFQRKEDWPDNLLMTPHSAGFGPGLLPDLTDEILEAIQALDNNRKPRHTVLSA